jgi:hypothetical protein
VLGWNYAHKTLGCLILVWSSYFLLLEIMKICKTGLSISLIPECVFLSLSIALVIINFSGANDTQFRIISVFILASSYMHLILYLRLFDSTAVLVSMIYYICKEILVFMIVFFIAVVAFANMFFVLQGVAVNMGVEPEDAFIVGPNFAVAII